MKYILFILSLFFCYQALSETYENPAVREHLRKQAAEAEAQVSGEVTSTKPTATPSATTYAKQGPPHEALTTNMCTDELKIFAARPSRNAPPLETCNMYLDTRFADKLKTHIPLCAKTAALKSGMGQIPVSVSIEQMGGFNVRPINTPKGPGDSWSRHSVGMALDISALVLDMGTYTRRVELTDKTQDSLFYKEFRNCWQKAIEIHGGKESCLCSIGHQHSHPYSNELHNDHMHVSLICPPQPKVAGC
jgi:hypothetical protein